MTHECSSRDDIANQVHQNIIALQDALTSLWASVLAVEVADVSFRGEVKREEALRTLKAACLCWQDAQSSLGVTFHEWTAFVGAQQQEIMAARAWLRAVCPESPDSMPGMALITDHVVAQRILDAVDREACDRTRRITGLPALTADAPCNCLIECPAVQICPLFNRSE